MQTAELVELGYMLVRLLMIFFKSNKICLKIRIISNVTHRL